MSQCSRASASAPSRIALFVAHPAVRATRRPTASARRARNRRGRKDGVFIGKDLVGPQGYAIGIGRRRVISGGSPTNPKSTDSRLIFRTMKRLSTTSPSRALIRRAPSSSATIGPSLGPNFPIALNGKVGGTIGVGVGTGVGKSGRR